MLLQTTAAHLVVGGGESIHKVAAHANEEMQAKGKGVEILAMPNFPDLFPPDKTDTEFLPAIGTPDLNHPALILHSSGRPRHSISFYHE